MQVMEVGGNKSLRINERILKNNSFWKHEKNGNPQGRTGMVG